MCVTLPAPFIPKDHYDNFHCGITCPVSANHCTVQHRMVYTPRELVRCILAIFHFLSAPLSRELQNVELRPSHLHLCAAMVFWCKIFKWRENLCRMEKRGLGAYIKNVPSTFHVAVETILCHYLFLQRTKNRLIFMHFSCRLSLKPCLHSTVVCK